MFADYIEIDAPDGGAFKAYVSRPPLGKGPGLLVVQEIFGVNSHIRAIADDYARQGYVAMAPDLYWRAEPGVELGYDTESIQKGVALRARIPMETTVRDLETAATALRALPEVEGGIGAVGYCYGGRLVFALAATGAIDAGVSYYGAGIVPLLKQAVRIKNPMQFHFGGLDQSIPHIEVEQIRDAFSGRSDVEIFVYDDADHGFNCDQRESYHRPSAELARSRSLQFLRDTIGPGN